MCPLTFVFWAIRIVWWRFPNWKYFYVVLVSKTFQYSFYSSSSSSSLRLVIFVDVCCSSRLRQHPQSRGSCTKKPVSASFEKNIFTHIFRKMKSEKSKRCVLCTRRLLSMFVAVDVVRPLLRPSVRPSIVYLSILSIGRGCCRRCLYHCQKYMKIFRSVWTCIKLLGGAGRVRLTTDTFVLNVNKKHECMYGRRTHFLFSFRLQCRWRRVYFLRKIS